MINHYKNINYINIIGIPSGQIIGVLDYKIRYLKTKGFVNWVGGNLGYSFNDYNYDNIVKFLKGEILLWLFYNVFVYISVKENYDIFSAVDKFDFK